MAEGRPWPNPAPHGWSPSEWMAGATASLASVWPSGSAADDTEAAIVLDEDGERRLRPVSGATGAAADAADPGPGPVVHTDAEPTPPGMKTGLIEMLMQPARECPDSLFAPSGLLRHGPSGCPKTSVDGSPGG